MIPKMTCETENLQYKNNAESMNPVTTIKEKCFQCLKGPKKIMRTLVFFVCFVVVIMQISECIKKIQNPPITTYTHFDFNETLLYPAVTLCRDPPYKYDVLQKYGLYGHPRFTSEWLHFPFGNITLSDFWNEATYNFNDNFIQLGFNGSTQDLHIITTLGFVLGNCHTIKANYLSTTATKDTGYSILLNHSLADMVTTTSTVPPGYHVYIHSQEESFAGGYRAEKWVYNTALFAIIPLVWDFNTLDVNKRAENKKLESYVGHSGLVDYLYVNVGEEVEIKLTVNRYIKIHKDDDPCDDEEDYSVALCSEMKSWTDVSAQTGCGGPWIHSDVRDCVNYTEMRNLIVNYLTEYNRVDNRYKTCHRRCRSFLYAAHVTNRRSSTLWDSTTGTWKYRVGNEVYQTQLYIHFNSMMVSVYQETHSYDWSLFLADLGGSVGFLLGLSVFGGIRIIEKLWDLLIKPIFTAESNYCEEENKQEKKLNNHPDVTDDIYFKTYDNRHFNMKQPLRKQ